MHVPKQKHKTLNSLHTTPQCRIHTILMSMIDVLPPILDVCNALELNNMQKYCIRPVDLIFPDA